MGPGEPRDEVSSLGPRAVSTNRLDLASFPGVCGQKPRWTELQGEVAGGTAAAHHPRHVVSRHQASGQHLTPHTCARPRFLTPRSIFSSPSQLDAKVTEVWNPGPATAAGLGVEEEILVTKLGLHSLSGEGVPLGSGLGGGS